MSKKYQKTDYIRVIQAVCVELGNSDDTWTWSYADVREALAKAKELLMKIEPGERLVVGITYCGQNMKTGEILELVPLEDDVEISGVKYGEYKTELFRLESKDFHTWPEGTPKHIFGDE